jgi:hypothetical protein
MKRTALLGVLFITAINVYLYGQNPNYPSVSSTPLTGTRFVDYTLNGVQTRWPAFYFFEDGHFSLKQNPGHEYFTGGTHTPRVYSATNYDPTFPSRVGSVSNPNTVPSNTIPFVGSLGSSSTNRPRFRAMSSIFGLSRLHPVNIGTSWGAVDGRKQLYIITFTNPYTDPGIPAVDGSIIFDLNPVIQTPNVEIWNPATTPNSSYNGWADGGRKNTNSTGDVESIEWLYSDLKPGEIRHLYVEVELPVGSHSQSLVSSVEMRWDDMFLGTDSRTATVATSVRKEPRDPNFIEVNHDFVRNAHPSQELEYTVGFFNDGEWYAEDVFVYVNLDEGETLGANSVELLSSSFPCKLSIITDNRVLFTFNDIFLPGLGQDSTFTHSDVSGFLRFSLCTNDNLQPGPDHLITADAEIYFDAIGPVITDPDTTEVEGGISNAPFCDVDGFLDGLSTPDQPISDGASFNSDAYPNPFSNQLHVPYEVLNEEGGNVSIKLYTITGQEQITLFSGYQYQGIYNFTHDTSSLPAGSYLLVIQNGNQRNTQRLIKLDQ